MRLPLFVVAPSLSLPRAAVGPAALLFGWAALLFTLAAVAPLAAQPALPPAAMTGGPISFAELAERLSPSVVDISTTQVGPIDPRPQLEDAPDNMQEFFDEFFERQQQRKGSTVGTGFVVDGEQGLIVTNKHVVETPETVYATFTDGTRAELMLLGTDETTDIALLRIKDKAELKGTALQPVTWGDSDGMRVGDWVLAIGNPFGLGGTVTAGIVSARSRNINSGRYDDFLQIDAPINRGNSGGPTFNMAGEVIGINTAIFSPGTSGGSVGIGFAIPSNLAQVVVGQLRDYGRTRRGWLGIKIQNLDEEIAADLGLERPDGVMVTDISPHGPAGPAGIKAGDVILALDEQQIRTDRDVSRFSAFTAPGTVVSVEILRDGERRHVDLTLGELEEAQERGWLDEDSGSPRETAPGEGKGEGEGEGEGQPGDPAEGRVETAFFAPLGLEVRSLTAATRAQYQIGEDVRGVVVSRLVPEGSAAGQLRTGDVITQISQLEVTSIAEAREAIDTVMGIAARPSVLMRVVRGSDRPTFVSIPIQR